MFRFCRFCVTKDCLFPHHAKAEGIVANEGKEKDREVYHSK